jgi:prepilin-type N-terminal cleavage/methylation domain-containing protein
MKRGTGGGTKDRSAGRPRAGLTLLEMIIVISIIGVLAALTIPVVSEAPNVAASTACSWNLRQVYMGVKMYAKDHQDMLPPKFDLKKGQLTVKEMAEGKRLNTPEEGIQTVLAAYVDASAFQCPADSGDALSDVPVFVRRGSSYDVKGAKPKDDDPKSYLSNLDRWDVVAEDLFKPWEAEDPKKVQEKVRKGELVPIRWHGHFFNRIMADGHIVSVRSKEEEEQAKRPKKPEPEPKPKK